MRLSIIIAVTLFSASAIAQSYDVYPTLPGTSIRDYSRGGYHVEAPSNYEFSRQSADIFRQATVPDFAAIRAQHLQNQMMELEIQRMQQDLNRRSGWMER